MPLSSSLELNHVFFAYCRLKDDHEELFNGRIEAPNKTYILENLFKGYDKRVRPYYRGKNDILST